jgi:hypothetical protein
MIRTSSRKMKLDQLIHLLTQGRVMRTILLFGLSLALAFFPDASHAQLSSGHFNPQEGTFTFSAPDGALIVAHAATQRMYLSAPNGGLSEISFQEAVAHAEPDPMKRPAMLAAMNNALADPDSAGAFALPWSSGGFEPEPPPCAGNGANPGGWESECTLQGLRGGGLRAQSGSGDELPEPTTLPRMEVLGMRPNLVSGGVFYFQDTVGNYANTDGNISYQEFYAYDFNRWQASRSAACEAAKVQSLLVAGTLLATAASCGAAAASGGLAAAGCGGMIVVSMISWGQMSALNKTCASGYPGPGNW